jgi:hypothetical protein
VRRLFRFLATVVVLLGLLPCEMREALPAVGELVAACCADEAEVSDPDGDGVDCCDTAACLGVARATAPVSAAEALLQDAYLLVDEPVRHDPQGWRAGPPPTPPPIA